MYISSESAHSRKRCVLTKTLFPQSCKCIGDSSMDAVRARLRRETRRAKNQTPPAYTSYIFEHPSERANARERESLREKERDGEKGLLSL